MSTDIFAALLKELESYFKCPLKPDQNQHCLISLPAGFIIQMEIDRSGRYFEISTRLGPLPTFGKFRETLFKETLKSNGLYPKGPGTFAFSSAANQLIFFTQIPMEDISGKKIIQVLTPFLEKAQNWVEAFNRGEVPVSEGILQAKTGLFGLMSP